MAPRFVFDVTGVGWRTHKRPTGIPRVQLEVASILAATPELVVEFCAFNARDRVYERVAASAVLEMAEQNRAPNQPADNLEPTQSRLGSRERAKGLAMKLAGPSPAAAEHIRRVGYHARLALSDARQAIDAARSEHRWRRRSPACFSNEWSPETIYCSVGADWNGGDLEYLGRRRSEAGFRVALTVFDLIPIVTPQYSSTDLTAHFRRVVVTADTLMVISKATHHDLRSFAEAQRLPLPPVVQLPLGSDLVNEEPIIPRHIEQPTALIDGRYVLSVGTVEIRKNQHLLLDVWEALVNEMGPNEAPRLVVAGQRGWLAEETFARLTRTPSLRGVVSFIEAPTDAELAWLYRNCEFTVFPARYEGWGLPVSESLDFDKMCLTANGSSLPEAGEGLTELLDPFDRAEWKAQILRYWTDRELRTEREEEIKRCHRHTTAADTAQVLLDLAESPG